MNWSDEVASKLSELVEYAKKNSPFYADRLTDIEAKKLTVSEFEKIPILFKGDMVGQEHKMLTCKSSDKLSVEYTSGSTGHPLKCYKGKVESIKKARNLWNLRSGNGDISPIDKYVMFYAFTEDKFKTDKILIENNVIYLSMLDMSAKVLDEYYEVLIKHKPKWILGVPSALQLFSDHIIKNKYSTDNLSVQYIESNGEMLFKFQKESIEKVFGPILFNHYGCREFWCLAMSCNNGSLHVLEDNFYYEVINVDDNGIGELVVTDFTNKTWPLIRYHLGDLVHYALNDCVCCNKNRILNVSGGRSQEYLKISDWVSNPILFHFAVIKTNNIYGQFIHNFRVTQKTEYELVMEVVINNKMDLNILNSLKNEIIRKLPKEALFSIEIVSLINFDSNKFKYFIPYRKGEEINEHSI